MNSTTDKVPDRENRHGRLGYAQSHLNIASNVLYGAGAAFAADPQHIRLRASARELVATAKEHLLLALEALYLSGDDAIDRAAGEIQLKLYRVFSTTCFASAALASEADLPDGEGVVESPLADMLQLCADLLGRDCFDGLAGEIEQLLCKVSHLPDAA